MASSVCPPLPREAVRDLLGIARALYRHTRARDPDNAELLLELTAVGKMLRHALSICTRLRPGDRGYLEAVLVARRATMRLGKAVGVTMTVHSIVRATGTLVTDGFWADAESRKR